MILGYKEYNEKEYKYNEFFNHSNSLEHSGLLVINSSKFSTEVMISLQAGLFFKFSLKSKGQSKNESKVAGEGSDPASTSE